ncbi:uncharacterized protein F4817DRAFT_348416 [Daldinia loculata]|uniref:uncharacterized protein n=1 Tax=Daldinia loculata TaxID=103429 RepID=UPI0020C51DE9|nr:uncharacterized protein F4817DRAFT_348416 [Daldinia loculata]KAI1643827.1 hypothetical protein F4817DRAFT_348416 [Daldinia loculata]
MHKMDSSPSKRRVLGSIDANARSPVSASKLQESKILALSPTPSTMNSAVKRPLDHEAVSQHQQHQQHPPTPPTKKQRLSVGEEEVERIMPIDEEHRPERDSREEAEEAERQQSKPLEEESLLLDNSVIDMTLEIAVTERDIEVIAPAPPTPPAPARRRSTMTREEARQKAEMLRLRLGLASYKVRTGQTDVSLEQLEAKSLLKSRRPEEPSLPPLSRITHAGEEHDKDGEDRGDKVPSSGRKALPTARPLSRGSSFDKGHLGTEKRQLPGLPIPWPGSRRASR